MPAIPTDSATLTIDGRPLRLRADVGGARGSCAAPISHAPSDR